jgi:hypothetical protein
LWLHLVINDTCLVEGVSLNSTHGEVHLIQHFRDTLVVMNTDYIGSNKFTYNMITTITAPSALVECGQYLFTVLKNIMFSQRSPLHKWNVVNTYLQSTYF